MDNEQENEKPENSKPSKIDIPSWLQGLENTDPENEIPEKSMDDMADFWVREVTDKPDHEQTQGSLDANAEDVESEKPDWLNQLSKIDSGTPANLKKDTEEPTFENPMANEATRKTEINEDLNAEEAYIELSEFELGENHENMQPTLEEQIENEEDLPDWLQEMIAEPSETDSEISQPQLEETIEEDEVYTDQMGITQETDISEFVEETEVSEIEEIADVAEVSEVEEVVDVAEVEEIAKLSEIEEIADMTEAEEIADVAEINDLYLSPTAEVINVADSAEDESDSFVNEFYSESPWADNSESIENDELIFEKLTHSDENGLPKILRFGKYLLDQKDFEPAIEIFSNYVGQSEHIEEIDSWLSEIAFDEAETNSSVWELIGDIAIIKAEPNQALTAYTQAIKTLLHAQE